MSSIKKGHFLKKLSFAIIEKQKILKYNKNKEIYGGYFV